MWYGLFASAAIAAINPWKLNSVLNNDVDIGDSNVEKTAEDQQHHC